MIICVAAMALALTGAACKKKGEEAGGGAAADICNQKSKCDKEDPMTPEQIKDCQDGLADKECGPLGKAAVECMVANESCTPEGTRDMGALMTKCEAPMKAMFECQAKKMAADAGAAAPPAP
jgi:hypothetical protein